MPPLTEEFIEGLKKDLRDNPIQVEIISTTDKNSQKHRWQLRQNLFDRHCMNWEYTTRLIVYLETAIIGHERECPDYPVYVKGTSLQQMGILLAVWYTDPDLLLKYYGFLQSYIHKAKKEKRSGQHLNRVCDNRGQILSILNFADCHHLELGTDAIREKELEEARGELAEKYDGVVHYWPMNPYGEMVDTLRMRVSEFVQRAAFEYEDGEPTELYVPEIESDLEEFFQEMWKQSSDTTIEYAEALHRSMAGKVLRNLPLSSDERERLCDCGEALDTFLHAIDPSCLSSDQKRMLEGYRADFPSLSIDTSEKQRQLQGSDSKQIMITEKGNRFEWDDMYSVVRLNGNEFCLRRSHKPTMAHRTIKYLTQEYLKKRTVVPFAELTDQIGSKATKIGDLFKGYKEAMILVRYGEDGVDSIGFSF